MLTLITYKLCVLLTFSYSGSQVTIYSRFETMKLFLKNRCQPCMQLTAIIGEACTHGSCKTVRPIACPRFSKAIFLKSLHIDNFRLFRTVQNLKKKTILLLQWPIQNRNDDEGPVISDRSFNACIGLYALICLRSLETI